LLHIKKGGNEFAPVPSVIKKTRNGTWSFTFPLVLLAMNIDKKKTMVFVVTNIHIKKKGGVPTDVWCNEMKAKKKGGSFIPPSA
jgi:hypothetical protein